MDLELENGAFPESFSGIALRKNRRCALSKSDGAIRPRRRSTSPSQWANMRQDDRADASKRTRTVRIVSALSLHAAA